MQNSYNCPICNYKGFYALTTKINYKIYKCSNENCGHFWLPNPKTNQGVYSRKEILNESNKSLRIFSKRNERLLKLFLKRLPKKNKLNFLDFGAGSAHVSRSFKNILSKKVEIYCLEADKKCSAFYPEWGLIPIENLKNLNIKFDLIYLIEVIEHLDNPREVLGELKCFLNKKSTIFLSTPFGSIDESKTSAYKNPNHIHFFTKKSLNFLLSSLGLESIKFERRSWMMINPRKFFLILIRNKIIDFLRILSKIFLKNNFNNHKWNIKNNEQEFHLMGFTAIKKSS